MTFLDDFLLSLLSKNGVKASWLIGFTIVIHSGSTSRLVLWFDLFEAVLVTEIMGISPKPVTKWDHINGGIT